MSSFLVVFILGHDGCGELLAAEMCSSVEQQRGGVCLEEVVKVVTRTRMSGGSEGYNCEPCEARASCLT